ncbi:MAG TPA: L-histidine N(alpha)-methyltransferase [Acidimicrobiales bacterium]
MDTLIPPTIDVHLTPDDLRVAMEADVRTGLSASPKHLPPVYFYDDRGSRLFDEITRLPEYYPTRAERSILESHAGDMVRAAGADVLVELGAGTCDKSRVLLDAMRDNGLLGAYVPLDVSDTTLWEAATALSEEYPGLTVRAVVGNFHHHLDRLDAPGRRLFAFLGGTVGNFEPAQRAAFVAGLADAMRPGDRFLLGTDVIKDRARLIAAYDDAAGVTAEFNRNVLHVLNRELGADFVPDRFAHVARWNEDDHRIEMWLRSLDECCVHIGDLGLDIRFAAGEEMLTEISTKFSLDALRDELEAGGLVVDHTWVADGDEFVLTLARRA